jgi:hypothetical protein
MFVGSHNFDVTLIVKMFLTHIGDFDFGNFLVYLIVKKKFISKNQLHMNFRRSGQVRKIENNRLHAQTKYIKVQKL